MCFSLLTTTFSSSRNIIAETLHLLTSGQRALQHKENKISHRLDRLRSWNSLGWRWNTFIKPCHLKEKHMWGFFFFSWKWWPNSWLPTYKCRSLQTKSKDKTQCLCSLFLLYSFCLLLRWYPHSCQLKQKDKPKHWVDTTLLSKCSHPFPSPKKRRKCNETSQVIVKVAAILRRENNIQGNYSQPPHPPF